MGKEYFCQRCFTRLARASDPNMGKMVANRLRTGAIDRLNMKTSTN